MPALRISFEIRILYREYWIGRDGKGQKKKRRRNGGANAKRPTPVGDTDGELSKVREIPRAKAQVPEVRPVERQSAMIQPHENGVFFGIPDDEYHSAFALSASGIKHIRASPLDFWVRSQLNPEYEAVQAAESTEFKDIGTAYHKRIVEGKAVFEKLYAAAVDPGEYPDALVTIDDIRERLRGLGLKVGGSKQELIGRLLEREPDAEILDDIKARHAEDHAGKTLLSSDLIRKIEIAAAMIEHHPQLGKAFTGGYPEVAIFWTDPEYQIPMKAKLDYLKRAAIVDLKTFTNVLGMPVEKAIAREIANRKYHIQAALYLEAVRQAKALIRENKIGLASEVNPDFFRDLCAAEEHTFLFVFQQKGVAPLARGKVIPGLTLDCGRVEIQDAKFRFAEAWKKFGDSPWVDESEIETFDPTAFPNYMMD